MLKASRCLFLDECGDPPKYTSADVLLMMRDIIYSLKSKFASSAMIVFSGVGPAHRGGRTPILPDKPGVTGKSGRIGVLPPR
jgi:hypothetical protein